MRLLCGDGFMLNFLSVMQELAVKVKVERVDKLYLNHPRCRVNVSDYSRFKATLPEVATWKETLGI